MTTFLFIILLFLKSFCLIGHARHDFLKQYDGLLNSINTNGGNILNGQLSGLTSGFNFQQSSPSSNILAADMLLKDYIDENNINRVTYMLLDHIRQWSFIEAQLLEPNVNLGMPEIIIPLKHLTTAYELLANILYMRENWPLAKECLEIVCPLMELLPSNAFDFGKKYPEDNCFNLLKDVYKELKSRKKDSEVLENFRPLDQSNVNIRRRIGSGAYLTSTDDHTDGRNEGDAKDFFGDIPADFDVDARILELRAPFDHLRTELRHQQQSSLRLLKESPLLMKEESSGAIHLPFLVFDDHSALKDHLVIAGVNLEEQLSTAITLAKELSNDFSVKLSDDVLTRIRKFVHENESGRLRVLEETRNHVNDIRQRLRTEGIEDDQLAYHMKAGDIVIEIMQQAIDKGLSFIGDELFNNEIYALSGINVETASIYDYDKIFSYNSPQLKDKEPASNLVNDHIRLFVLDAFYQVMEAGEIGIGSNPKVLELGNKDGLKISNHPRKSRREKRKQLDTLVLSNDDIETPETIGILKQGNFSSSNERYSIVNVIIFVFVALIPIGGYFFYHDYQRRHMILISRYKNRINTIGGSIATTNQRRNSKPSLVFEVLMSYVNNSDVDTGTGGDAQSTGTTASIASAGSGVKAKKPTNAIKFKPSASSQLSVNTSIHTKNAPSSPKGLESSKKSDAKSALLGIMMFINQFIQSHLKRKEQSSISDSMLDTDSQIHDSSPRSPTSSKQAPIASTKQINSTKTPSTESPMIRTTQQPQSLSQHPIVPIVSQSAIESNVEKSVASSSSAVSLLSQSNSCESFEKKADDDILDIIAEIEASTRNEEDGWIVATQRSNRDSASGNKKHSKQTTGPSTIVANPKLNSGSRTINHKPSPSHPTRNSSFTNAQSKPSTKETHKTPPSATNSTTAPMKPSIENFPPLPSVAKNNPSKLPRSPPMSATSESQTTTSANSSVEGSDNISINGIAERFDGRSYPSHGIGLGTWLNPKESHNHFLPPSSSFPSDEYSSMSTMTFGGPQSHSPDRMSYDLNLVSAIFGADNEGAVNSLGAPLLPTLDQYVMTSSELTDSESLFAFNHLLPAVGSSYSPLRGGYPSYENEDSFNGFSGLNEITFQSSVISDSRNNIFNTEQNGGAFAEKSRDRSDSFNDLDDIRDIAIQAPIFTLSAEAPSFTPSQYTVQSSPLSSEINYNYSLVAPVDPYVSMASQQRTVMLMCSCSVLTAVRTKILQVVLYSDGNPSEIMSMKRLVANPSAWGAVVALPIGSDRLSYKYIAQDVDNFYWEEVWSDGKSYRVADLTAHLSVPGMKQIEIDDRMETARIMSLETTTESG